MQAKDSTGVTPSRNFDSLEMGQMFKFYFDGPVCMRVHGRRLHGDHFHVTVTGPHAGVIHLADDPFGSVIVLTDTSVTGRQA